MPAVRRAVATLLLAVALPAVAVLVIGSAEAHLESVWRAELIKQFGPQPESALDSVRLVRLCSDADARAGLHEACSTIDLMELFRPLGIVAIALSVGALLGLIPLRRLAARNRRILAWFRPFLLVLLLVLTILVILDGALVAGAAYLGELAYTDGVHPFVMFGIAVAVIVAASGVLRAAMTMGRVRPSAVRGIALDRGRDHALFGAIDDIAHRIGAAAPDQIIAGMDATFFVTETPVAASDGTYHGRTLFLSMPFIRMFSRSELLAVIGHELGHFRGEDTIYSRRFYPVYRASLESLAVLRGSTRGWTGIPLLPPLLILQLFFDAFIEAERGLSRKRELAADAVGAEAESAADVATALVKLAAFAPAWVDAFAESETALRDGRPPINLSARFAQLARLAAGPKALADIDDGRIRHPTDSHPPTSERIAALGVDAAAAASAALDLEPSDPAFALIDKGESLEEDLMEDLAAAFAASVPAIDAAEALDPSAVIRAASMDDPAIAGLIELIEPIRGRDLQPWLRLNVAWITLAELEVRPHPEPRGFLPLIAERELPSGDQQLVVGLASERTALGDRLPGGTRLSAVGISLPDQRRLARTELMLAVGGRIVTIRLVGDWPIEHQVAGAFVVSEPDPLAALDGAFAGGLATVVSALVGREVAAVPAFQPGAQPV
jgi:Zn-dependent protease with chaperone function